MVRPQRAPQGGRDGRRTGDTAVVLTLLEPLSALDIEIQEFLFVVDPAER